MGALITSADASGDCTCPVDSLAYAERRLSTGSAGSLHRVSSNLSEQKQQQLQHKLCHFVSIISKRRLRNRSHQLEQSMRSFAHAGLRNGTAFCCQI